MFSNSIKLPYFDYEILIKYINYFLSKIEGLKSEYNKGTFTWELEWGTKEIEYTIDRSDYKLIQIIKQNKKAAILASIEANKKFPNNINFDEEESDSDFNNNKWCKFIITLDYLSDDNSLLVYNRLIGDVITYYDIISKFKKNLNDKKNLNWFKRLGYIMFVDNIDEKYINNHIMKYICNDLIMKEISSFI